MSTLRSSVVNLPTKDAIFGFVREMTVMAASDCQVTWLKPSRQLAVCIKLACIWYHRNQGILSFNSVFTPLFKSFG